MMNCNVNNWGYALANGNILIKKNVLEELLRQGGYDFDTVKHAWARLGLLKMFQGRYTVTRNINGTTAIYVEIVRKK